MSVTTLLLGLLAADAALALLFWHLRPRPIALRPDTR